MDRRRFLRAGALAGLAAASAAPLTECSSRRELAAAPTESAWKDLESHLSGRLLRPEDAQFTALGMPYNVRLDAVRPAAVAVCRTPEDVAYALTWSRENNVPRVPRSGGHSFEGYSTNEGLVISVSAMNSVRYQTDSHYAVIAGGAQNKDVFDGLTPVNVMIPGGQCPTVGVAGLTLGGGVGFSMRSLGTTSDSLISSRLVLANGDIVTASATENPDLFWALRGGTGGNFGINTEFTFAATPARDCTHFAVEFPAGRAAATLDAWFTMLADAPRELGLVWYQVPAATPTDAPICGTWGQMYGSVSDTRDVLAPVIRAGGTPLTDEFIHGSYRDAVAYLSQTEDTPKPFRDRSRFLDTAFGTDAIAVLAERLDRQPHHLGNTSVFALGGAVGDIASAETAFVHRDAVGLIKYSATWNPGDTATRDASTRWVTETFEAMEPYCTRRSFQNFPDGDLHDWAQAYFGQNLTRLSEVKRKYDPNRVFTFPQAIPYP